MRPGKPGRWTLELPALLELVGVSALAVAQPVFSLLRRNTELLLVNGANGETAIAFTAHLGSPSPIQAAFDHPERYRSVAPEADNPPVYVSGKAAPSSADTTPLVITVNGVVAAYTSPTVTLDSRGATVFFANIPPQLLRAGTDKLGLAQIVESGSGLDATVTLHPLKVHAP